MADAPIPSTPAGSPAASASGELAIAASPVVLRATANGELMDAWSLTLHSQGIANQVLAQQAMLTLWVAAADQARASRVLALADRDRKDLLDAQLPPAPDQGPSAAGLAFVIVIAAFHWVTGERGGADRAGWFRRGAAIAEAILGGEPWRAVTALTLHADPVHVTGNALAALLFVTAVGRWLGTGPGLLLTLWTGIAGNLLVAAVYGSHHNSVGASTATFGALGLLGGLQVVRWLRGGGRFGVRRRVLSIIAACLGVFAMLGVGEKSDVLAHLAGLGFGLATGALVGRTVRLPLPGAVRVGSGVLAAVIVAGAWLLAFRR